MRKFYVRYWSRVNSIYLISIWLKIKISMCRNNKIQEDIVLCRNNLLLIRVPLRCVKTSVPPLPLPDYSLAPPEIADNAKNIAVICC